MFKISLVCIALAFGVATAAENEASLAIAELEQWAKNLPGGLEQKGKFFSFSAGGPKYNKFWAATSKVKIGNCPAKSEWIALYEVDSCDRDNTIPKGCESITPEAFTSWKGNWKEGGCEPFVEEP